MNSAGSVLHYNMPQRRPHVREATTMSAESTIVAIFPADLEAEAFPVQGFLDRQYEATDETLAHRLALFQFVAGACASAPAKLRMMMASADAATHAQAAKTTPREYWAASTPSTQGRMMRGAPPTAAT